jgi:hypothetical protein
MGSDQAEADRAERRRLANARYNTSSKGQARNQRYELAHPERRSRARWNTLATNRGRGTE